MARLGSAAAQMILAPGAHMIWQFSELGNYDNTKNNDGGNNTDPKIVRWNLYDSPDRRGLYDSYSEMIDIRNSNPDLFSEEATFENSCAIANWANGRTLVSKYGDKELFTVINPNADKEITVTVSFSNSDNAAYQILSKSYDSEPSFSASAKTVTVPANCYVVIGSQSVSGVEEIVAGNAASELRAYAADGRIVVDYAAAGVDVYAADGKKVASISKDGSVNVAPGVYLLCSGSSSRKLLVR